MYAKDMTEEGRGRLDECCARGGKRKVPKAKVATASA
jgi:hypothetical protein